MSQGAPSSMVSLLRELAPNVLSAIVRRFRDFSASEDAVQEALIAATLQWPKDGIPHNPRGWLIQVAIRRLTDYVRAESARRTREAIVVSLISADEQLALSVDDEPIENDDTLELLFRCCHPSLSSTSAIALTLRAIGGLTTFEIARAFMVPETTMAQRISRAKQSIKTSGIPFTKPSETERNERLTAVMHVLYLIFSEGYTATSGPEIHRVDLSSEAIRLTRMLLTLVPDNSEVAGLLALMLLTDARRSARVGNNGELVPLDQQDRGLWDQGAIVEGVELITKALSRQQVGPYQVQAAIAAVHSEATSSETTDWPQILGLYNLLLSMSDNPMAMLSQAIAIAMVHGPMAGLTQLDALSADPRLKEHHRFYATRAHLLERSGQFTSAATYYQKAAELTTSTQEQHYLQMQAAKVRARE